MQNNEVLTAIQKGWIHSHEEDTETEMVFRPTDFDFPLSRGRSGFELKPDHKLVEINIGLTDGLKEKTGSWDLKPADDEDLTLQLNPDSSASRSLNIKSVRQDRLVVKKG